MEGRVVGRRPRRSRVEGACDADVATDGNVVTKQPGEEDIVPPIVYLRGVVGQRAWRGVTGSVQGGFMVVQGESSWE